MEVLAVGVFVWRVFEDLSQQQRVFDQATAWYVQEAPEVQFAAEGRLQTALEEVVHPMVLLLMVQQCFGCHLVTAVAVVGFKTRELQPERDAISVQSADLSGSCSTVIFRRYLLS